MSEDAPLSASSVGWAIADLLFEVCRLGEQVIEQRAEWARGFERTAFFLEEA